MAIGGDDPAADESMGVDWAASGKVAGEFARGSEAFGTAAGGNANGSATVLMGFEFKTAENAACP
jgi:hypothetical protein